MKHRKSKNNVKTEDGEVSEMSVCDYAGSLCDDKFGNSQESENHIKEHINKTEEIDLDF